MLRWTIGKEQEGKELGVFIVRKYMCLQSLEFNVQRVLNRPDSWRSLRVTHIYTEREKEILSVFICEKWPFSLCKSYLQCFTYLHHLRPLSSLCLEFWRFESHEQKHMFLNWVLKLGALCVTFELCGVRVHGKLLLSYISSRFGFYSDFVQ